MRVSLGQITILLLIVFLLFGDFQSLKEKLTNTLKQINNSIKKINRKKGI